MSPELIARRLLVWIPMLTMGCSKSETSASAASPPAAAADNRSALAELPDRDPALAHRLVKEQGAILLDVRTPEEYSSSHLDGATNIPHDQIQSRIKEVLKLAGDDKTKPIIVYCGSGRRAGKAKTTLKEAGFSQVTNLGGINDWCDKDCSRDDGPS